MRGDLKRLFGHRLEYLLRIHRYMRVNCVDELYHGSIVSRPIEQALAHEVR
ncbi:MAG: hypothetical protein ABSF15_19730 [Candidatus Sulfotelmatobacter sp.]